jgi:hypothetical protein
MIKIDQTFFTGGASCSPLSRRLRFQGATSHVKF